VLVKFFATDVAVLLYSSSPEIITKFSLLSRLVPTQTTFDFTISTVWLGPVGFSNNLVVLN
jgi:hypothetical protein